MSARKKRLYIVGAIGSGKTTVESFLVERKFRSYQIAGPMNEIARAILDNDAYSYDQVMSVLESVFCEPHNSWLKDMAQKLTDSDIVSLEYKKDVVEVKPRKLLQLIGAVGRSLSSGTFWVERLVERIEKERYTHGVFISDVRLVVEHEFLAQRGFLGIKILVPSDIRRFRVEKRDNITIPLKTWNEWANDPTETEVERIETQLVIDNSKTLEDLFNQLNTLITENHIPITEF